MKMKKKESRTGIEKLRNDCFIRILKFDSCFQACKNGENQARCMFSKPLNVFLPRRRSADNAITKVIIEIAMPLRPFRDCWRSFNLVIWPLYAAQLVTATEKYWGTSLGKQLLWELKLMDLSGSRLISLGFPEFTVFQYISELGALHCRRRK